MKWPLIALCALIFPVVLAAQERTTLSVTGLPITFRSPTAADLTNGFVPTSSTASYLLKKSGGSKISYVTLYLSCQGICPTQGDPTGVTLQWRLAGTSTWITMTTTPTPVTAEVTVDPRNRNGVSGAVEFQMLVNAATLDGTRIFGIVFTQSARVVK